MDDFNEKDGVIEFELGTELQKVTQSNPNSENSNMIENPFNKPIIDLYTQLKSLNYKGLRFITSSITACVFVTILVILAILWIYGFFPVMATTLWRFISIAIKTMEHKKIMEKMPYAVEIGAFFIIWIPFAIACIPFLIVSLIGHFLNLCIEAIDSGKEN